MAKKGVPMVAIKLRMKAVQVKAIDQLAHEIGMSRSALIRGMIGFAAEEVAAVLDLDEDSLDRIALLERIYTNE